MNAKEYMDRVEKRYLQRIELCQKKSCDYANEDVLSNFKRVGAIEEILRIKELPAPLTYGFHFIILKLDRWINLLLKDTEPKNETLDDTIQDLENYIDLTEATYSDLKGGKN